MQNMQNENETVELKKNTPNNYLLQYYVPTTYPLLFCVFVDYVFDFIMKEKSFL